MDCTLYLADNCNLECTYCYEGHQKGMDRISKTTVEKAIDFLEQKNTDREIDLTFLGGEPMLNKEMMYYAVEYSKKKLVKFNYIITTNGTCCDKKDIDYMHENGFKVSLSIDGDRRTHELNRKIKGKDDAGKTYDIIIENLKYMVKNSFPVIIRMTVTCNNVQYLYSNVLYFYNMGVTKLDIEFNEFEEWKIHSLQLLEHELQKLDFWYLSNGDKIKYLSLFDGKITFFIAKRKVQFCNAGRKSHFVINSKGEFYPCNYVCNQEQWKIGNLKTVFDEKKCFNNIKLHIEKQSKCTECEINFACVGARCGFKNFNLTGFLNKPNDNLCNLEKILYKHNELVFAEMYRRKDARLMNLLEYALVKGYPLTNWMIELMEQEKEC